MVKEDYDDQFKNLSLRALKQINKLEAIRNDRLRFVQDHHTNTRGERMTLDNCPHIHALYDSAAAVIIVMGSVQSYKSEWLIIDHFAAAFNGLNVFFVLPKFDMRNAYVQNRINKRVNEVREYKKIIGNGFFDSIQLKDFGKGTVKYVGSNVPADFTEFPGDILYVEEVDQCDKKNVEMALDRLRASDYQFKRYLANPSIKGEGIHAFFLKSNQKEWYIPCTKCGEFAELDWFDTIVEEVLDKSGNIVDYILRDKEWKPGIRRDVHCMCPKEGCGGVLERGSNDGKWVAQNPESDIDGFHISMMCSPINAIAEMWEKFREALNDPGVLKLFYNSYLGLPFDAAGNKVTEAMLERCVKDDHEFLIRPNCAYIPEDESYEPCSMGIDVGQTCDVRISQPGARGVRKLVYSGKISAHRMDEVHELIERYNVEVAVIDAGPELMLSLDFQDNADCQVWLCRYGAEGGERGRKFNTSDYVINIDRTEALDRTYGCIRRQKVILPHNFKAILSGQMVDEMCGPVRQITEDARGNPKYEWTKCTDHQRHADVYDFLAAEVMGDSIIGDIDIG